MSFFRKLFDFIKRSWIVLACMAIYFVAMNLLNMGCIFEWLTGISCPGCGLTRAWLCVLGLDFAGAFYYHPLWLVIPVMVVIYVVYDGLPIKDKKVSNTVTAAFAVLVLGVYIWRMFFMENSPIGIDLSSSFILKLLKLV